MAPMAAATHETISAALVEVEPGGMRELHWHPNTDEWQYYIEGQARMGVFAASGQARTFNFTAGDVGYVPFAMGHYVENTGTTLTHLSPVQPATSPAARQRPRRDVEIACGARWYNFAALTTTQRLVNEQPQIAAGAVHAIVETQKALKADPSLAAAIGGRLFPGPTPQPLSVCPRRY
jgi:mannose-6-phosphate isomerase-like protein (cupin superfamily)